MEKTSKERYEAVPLETEKKAMEAGEQEEEEVEGLIPFNIHRTVNKMMCQY